MSTIGKTGSSTSILAESNLLQSDVLLSGTQTAQTISPLSAQIPDSSQVLIQASLLLGTAPMTVGTGGVEGSPQLQAELKQILQHTVASSRIAGPTETMPTMSPIPMDSQTWAFLAQGQSATPSQLVGQAQGLLQSLSAVGTSSAHMQPLQKTVQQMATVAQGSLSHFDFQHPTTTPPRPEQVQALAQMMTLLQQFVTQLIQLPLPVMPSPTSPHTGSHPMSHGLGMNMGVGMGMGVGTAYGTGISPAAGMGAMPTGGLSAGVSSMSEATPAQIGSDGKTPNPGVKAAQNMGEQEKATYREKIQKAIKDGDEDLMKELAKDPKAMAMATPSEKAKMIKEFISGWTKDSEDRAMLDIAESCTSKEEFDEVMRMSGGKKVVDEMDHEPSKKRMNMLCGMWGRSEWANNKKDADLAKDALIDPQKGAEMAGVDLSGIQGLQQADPSQFSGSPADQVIAGQQHRMQQRSFDIQREPKAYKELIMTNAMRKEEGKEPLNWAKINEEVLQTLNDSKLSEKKEKVLFFEKPSEKEKALDKIREKYGLDTDTMRELYTQRHGEIFKTGAQEIRMEGQGVLQNLVMQMQQAALVYGEDSPEVKQLQAQIQEAQQKLAAEGQRLEDTGKFTESLYPVPKSFWEGFVDALASIGKFFLKAFDFLSPLLNLIPGVGTALYAGYQGVKLVVNAIQGDIGGAFGSALSMIPGIGGAVGGVAKQVMDVGAKVLTAGKGLVDTIRTGNPLAMLGSLGGVAGGLGSIGGKFGDTMNMVQKGINLGTSGATVVKGLADGNIDAALSGLGGLSHQVGNITGGVAKQVMGHVGQGLTTINNLAQGRWGDALQGLDQTLQPLTAHSSAARDVMKYVQPGLHMAEGIASGNYAQAADSFLQAAGPMAQQSPAVQQALQTVQPAAQFLGGIANGHAGQALQGLHGTLDHLVQHPELKKGVHFLQDTGSWLGSLPTDPQAALRSLPDSPLVGKLLQGIQSGALGQGLQSVSRDVQHFLQNPALREGMQWIQHGTSFVDALQQGHISSALQTLQQQQHPLSQQPFFSPLLDWTRSSEQFMGGLVDGQFDHVLGQLQQSVPSLVQDPQYQEFLHQTAPFASFAQQLHQGTLLSSMQGMNRMWQSVTDPTPVLQMLTSLQHVFSQQLQQVGSVEHLRQQWHSGFAPSH